jgi:hypothetical protein
MKTCYKCKETKEISSFYKNKTKKDKLDTSCKECSKQRYYLWRDQNYKKALEYNRQSAFKWRNENPDKNTAKTARYNAKKLKATPSWLTNEQKSQIESVYWLARLQQELTDEQYHVDHIVPLRGKTVCGLHVPWNLQVMSAKENMTKGNKLNASL